MFYEFLIENFEHNLARARRLCQIYEDLKTRSHGEEDAADLLRAAVLLCSSSLDYFVHELVRLETLRRVQDSRQINKLLVPTSAMYCDGAERWEIVNSHVIDVNSYKSFIAPDKIAECLSQFVERPWSGIARRFGENESVVKERVRFLANWRNRIAHEADIDPTYGGTNLWPIFCDDVVEQIDFLRILARHMAHVVSN